MKIDWILNGGYAGRDQSEVQHHIDELAALGVPAPKTTPTLYPLSQHLVSQGTLLQAPHARSSGEAEWAMIVGDNPDDILIAAACDHTDRALEVHGVAWSKQSFPDMIGDVAWRYADIEASLDGFTLQGWVSHGGTELLIQDGTPAQLLSPRYWIDRLRAAGLLRAGTLLLSGTIPMTPGIDQFAEGWRVALADGAGNVSRVAYRVDVLPRAWE
ncbi:DUF2848 family protein [Methylobacterium sp. J-077]|uniref:DUF2848 family protein n=1 Tax=Methylobacterium sp. J-077 TaxID=2836656 RepID=UPI001FBB7B1A|nr:DUF2848 family protein [Methylobacterium sp. J-077]MCJ2125000.1 DUF2848 domain-containing protein [Methylobacterium sp. J-077]